MASAETGTEAINSLLYPNIQQHHLMQALRRMANTNSFPNLIRISAQGISQDKPSKQVL
jgi:hypothetical protein